MDLLRYLLVPLFNEIPRVQQLLFTTLHPELHGPQFSLPLTLLMTDHDVNLPHQLLELRLT